METKNIFFNYLNHLIMTSSRNVFEISDRDFEQEVLKSNALVLVNFSATWCGPCKALNPVIDKIADDYEGKIKVTKLDIDDSPETTTKYNVRSVPTVILFRGGEKKGQVVGLTTRDNLIRLAGL
jgi:thioredoxin 1